MLTKQSKKIIMDFIELGSRNKEDIILKEEELELLKKLKLLKENNTKITINPEKITVITGENKNHYFFVNNNGEKVEVNYLNEESKYTFKFETTTNEEIIPKLEEFVEQKEKINREINKRIK